VTTDLDQQGEFKRWERDKEKEQSEHGSMMMAQVRPDRSPGRCQTSRLCLPRTWSGP
jgi:hypothetical protein